MRSSMLMKGTLVLVAGLLAGGAAWAEDLAGVEKQITEKVGQLKSYQYQMKTTQDLNMGEMKYKSENETRNEALRDGKVWKYRMEGTTKSEMTGGGMDQKEQIKMLMISDGEFLYSLNETEQQKIATKMKVPEKSDFVADEAYFEQLRKEYELKLLPEEKVDGRTAWVIEAKAKQAAATPGAPTTMVNYFDKDTGLMIKSVGKDADGKVVVTSVISDLKINPTLSPERFAFKAPEGVQVIDMTAGGMPPPPKQP